ncbi:Hypothetical predicted protein [Mytilus galloprovincialis]|uniref:LRAT domain-containing protein n=1 Tax=Mytilus galloprovincialis TaxID=29158 RepID=A0A8B6CNV6_MYTGA|nr:Hypothetical predicted protein [Mytilus galloprovincialis]
MSGQTLPINDSVEHEEQKKPESHTHVTIVSADKEKLMYRCDLDRKMDDATVQDEQLHPNKRLPTDVDLTSSDQDKTTSYSLDDPKILIDKDHQNTHESGSSRIANFSAVNSLPRRQRLDSFLSIRKNMQHDGSSVAPTPGDSESRDDSESHDDSESQEDFELYNSSPFNTTNRSTEDNTTALHISCEELSEMSGCIECVKAIPVFSANEIQEGDHIVFAGTVYDHHAIVESKLPDKKFEIIEATNTIFGVATGLFLGKKALIGKSTKLFNFATQNLRVIAYRVRPFTRKETAQRARDFVAGDGTSGKYDYDLLDNNCEHFATYCVTGRKFSIQVTKFRLTSSLFWKSGFIGISDESVRNEKQYEHGIICKQCFEINRQLFNVNVKPIVQAGDVQKGNILRYSYWNLWHDAVILEIKDVKESHVTCFIAHYAFCGIFSHRTILREELIVYFDSGFKILDYSPPDFNVYDVETVIERASGRLGEQQFIFFSNDSSHFSRWCKLKREKSNRRGQVVTFETT